MQAAMKCTLLTIFFVIAIVNANYINDIFSGGDVYLGPFNIDLSIGNVTEKYFNITKEDNEATANARILTEHLRRMFKVGIYPLPPLDPYVNTDLNPYQLPLGSPLTGNIHFDYVEVTGAQNFVLDLLELRMSTGRLDYAISFPYLSLIVDFRTDVLIHNLLPMKLSGRLSYGLKSVELVGAMQHTLCPLIPHGHYEVTGAFIYARVDNLTAQYNGNDPEIELLRSLNTAVEAQPLLAMMSTPEQDVGNHVFLALIQQINDALNKITADQILAYLLPSRHHM